MRYHVFAAVLLLASVGISAVVVMIPYARLFLIRPERTATVALATAAMMAVTVWLILDQTYDAVPVLVAFGSIMLSVVVWVLQWTARLGYDRVASALVAASALALWSQIDTVWVLHAVAIVYFHAFYYEIIARTIHTRSK